MNIAIWLLISYLDVLVFSHLNYDHVDKRIAVFLFGLCVLIVQKSKHGSSVQGASASGDKNIKVVVEPCHACKCDPTAIWWRRYSERSLGAMLWQMCFQ